MSRWVKLAVTLLGAAAAVVAYLVAGVAGYFYLAIAMLMILCFVWMRACQAWREAAGLWEAEAKAEGARADRWRAAYTDLSTKQGGEPFTYFGYTTDGRNPNAGGDA